MDRTDDRAAVAPSGQETFGARISWWAERRRNDPAIIFLNTSGQRRIVSWGELDEDSNCVAHLLTQRGVSPGRRVAIELSTSPEHVVAAIGTWKSGGCVLPLNPGLPPPERAAVLGVARPTVIVREESDDSDHRVIRYWDSTTLPSWNDRDPPVPYPARAMTSGGSTGTPKIIVLDSPGVVTEGTFAEHRSLGLRPDQVQIVPGALFHNTPFSWAHAGLQIGQTIVLIERFDPSAVLSLISDYSVGFMALVPTMMRRLVEAPQFKEARLESLQTVFHTAGPCPDWVREAWIDRIGASRLVEGYGATEPIGSTQIRGDEWLEHRGSVGRGWDCDLRILRGDGSPADVDETGVIYMKPHDHPPRFHYLGQPPPDCTHDGYYSVGDLGWLDKDGYLFFADRRVDMIVTGGVNVYPAEVEGVLLRHPLVDDVAVIGLPHSDWGKQVYAVVQPKPGAQPGAADLREHCRAHLAAYKVPKAFEFVGDLPRNEAGKLRRQELTEARAVGIVEDSS